MPPPPQAMTPIELLDLLKCYLIWNKKNEGLLTELYHTAKMKSELSVMLKSHIAEMEHEHQRAKDFERCVHALAAQRRQVQRPAGNPEEGEAMLDEGESDDGTTESEEDGSVEDDGAVFEDSPDWEPLDEYISPSSFQSVRTSITNLYDADCDPTDHSKPPIAKMEAMNSSQRRRMDIRRAMPKTSMMMTIPSEFLVDSHFDYYKSPQSRERHC